MYEYVKYNLAEKYKMSRDHPGKVIKQCHRQYPSMTNPPNQQLRVYKHLRLNLN